MSVNSQIIILRSQDQSALNDIQKFQDNLGESRSKFLKKLNDYICDIRTKLTNLKAEIHGDFSMELRDADYYRVNMFQLEAKITELKQSINIEMCSLMKEENEHCRDLQLMERRAEEWTKQTAVPLRAVKSAAPAYRSSFHRDTDTEFQKFVTLSGGHTGGWDEQDHVLFLREWRKYKGKPKFLTVVQGLLPDISQDEIKTHEQWCLRYEQLKKEQKDEIKKWRESRQSSLEMRQKPELPTEERDGSVSKTKSYAQQRDITERIKVWKRQQLLKKAEEEERQREEQLRQQEERRRKKEIQKAKKSAVNAYKIDKLGRMQAEMLSNQMRELQALEDKAKKNVLLKAFQEQDQQLLEKRRLQKLRAEIKEKQREERLRNVRASVNLDRDPERLMQPTQTWQHHIHYQPDDLPRPLPLALHNIPHLAMSVIALKEARRFIVECMHVVGTPTTLADQLAELLTAADYRGHYSHGLNRLEIYVKDIENKVCNPAQEPKILKESVSTAWVDGQNGLGPVVGKFCMDLAIEKAKETGVSVVTAKGSNHYGIAGWYAMRALEQNMIGMSFTNTSPLLVPTRAKEAALGTNPLAVAAPGRNGDSMVLDMATTTVAVGKIEVQMKKNEPIPEGWAMDESGHITTDAVRGYQANRLMPLGGVELNSGYKGYGLALLVELLCGVLGGATVGPNVRRWGNFDKPADLGQCFIVVDPARFAPGFEGRLGDLLDSLRAMQSADDRPVLVPGDPERAHMDKVDKQGGICYHENQLKLAEKLAARLRIPPMKPN